MANKIILDIKSVYQSYGDRGILYDVNLQVAQGQFVALVGSSGCGKTTLLKAILGTNPPSLGSIEIDQMKITGPNRHVGIVYQKYQLYEFLTVLENVAFGPMLDKTTPLHRMMFWKWLPLRKQQRQEATELLEKLKLAECLNHYPSQLSGGMQQRVAIAQSLIMKPKILLLDEPFGALDESTRADLQKMLLKLYSENIAAKRVGKEPPWTVVFVTHELNEAFYISDRVVGLSRNWHEDKKFDRRLEGKIHGATKVWDQCAPVYEPDAPKNFELFHHSKMKLIEVVLNSKNPSIQRDEHVSFWADLKNNVGTGVAIL